jgi:serine/threonine protein kinase
MRNGPGSSDLGGEANLAAIADLCAEFATGWQRGERPRIEAFLERAAPADRANLLSRLIACEISCRRGLGESPAAEEYLSRFPSDSALIEAMLFETEQTAHLFESTREVLAEELADPNADFVVGGDPGAPLAEGEAADPPTRFQRMALLGRGGFGEVWRAHDSRLKREVALKVPRSDKAVPARVHRQFLAEARKVAALDSIPGIVRVFDVGATAAGFCIVMQLIDGETLAARIADRSRPRLTQRESAQLVADIATALDEVHRHPDSITHRDLKPQNILLDKKGRPHITDFGLAVSEMEQLAEGSGQQGTRAYLSPEQARFESNKVDGRSDIFSLGVIFYQLLTGVRPFEGKTADECVRAILVSEPRPLRARDASIPRELERICLRCLEKRMGDRYLTAGDLADDLKRWLNPPESTVAEQSSSSLAPPPATAPRQPRTLVTALAVGGMLAMLAGILAYILYPSREKLNPNSPGTPATDIQGIGSPHVPAQPLSRTEKEFRDVFGQLPKVMSWEGKRGRGTQKFVDEPNLRALEISSEMVWLVELCEMPSGDFDFSMELRQPNWVGRIGVCLGKHLEEQGDRHILCDTFQLLRLHYLPGIPNVTRGQFQMERQKAYIDAPNRTPQLFAAMELGTQPIAAPWDAATPRLEFSVRSHRLTRVAWNGEEISELVADVWEEKLTPADYEGPLGIYVENATVWCGKPVLQRLNPGEKE